MIPAYDSAMTGARDPVSHLESALGAIVGAPVELERPGDPDHGDYATNVALKLAPTRGKDARDLAADDVEGLCEVYSLAAQEERARARRKKPDGRCDISPGAHEPTSALWLTANRPHI